MGGGGGGHENTTAKHNKMTDNCQDCLNKTILLRFYIIPLTQQL